MPDEEKKEELKESIPKQDAPESPDSKPEAQDRELKPESDTSGASAMEPEEGPCLEPSSELKAALDEAVRSFERAEEKKRKKDEGPPPPTEQELKLKLEILDLRHRVQELEAELDKKAKEVKQNYEQGMMLKNQLDSYKMRVQKEKADWFNYGHEPVFKELLPILDNFERALAHAKKPEDFDALKQGIEMIYRQLLKMLESFGVKQIDALGQSFNPAYHEAMAQINTQEHLPGVVIEEHSKGYLLKDRLLRASKVTISALSKVESAGGVEPSQQGLSSRSEVSEQKQDSSEIKVPEIENPEKPGGEKS